MRAINLKPLPSMKLTTCYVLPAVEERKDSHWYPWICSQLQTLGLHAEVLEMPEPNYPERAERVATLERRIETTEDKILVCHSVGVAAALCYLQNLPEGKQIRGVVLIAGFTDPMGYTHRELKHEEKLDELVFGSFFESPLDLDKIRSRAKTFIVISGGEEDPYINARYGEELSAGLGAELIVQRGMGHMSVGVKELPCALDAVKRIAGIV